MMTWGEFKKYLESRGVTDDLTVETIEVDHPTDNEEETAVMVYTTFFTVLSLGKKVK